MSHLISISLIIFFMVGCQVQSARIELPVYDDSGIKAGDCEIAIIKDGKKNPSAECKK